MDDDAPPAPDDAAPPVARSAALRRHLEESERFQGYAARAAALYERAVGRGMAPIADAGVAAAAALYCELRREGAPILLVDAVCDVAGPGRAHEVRHAVARVNEVLGGSPRIVRAEELARRYGPVILADARVDGGRSALDLAAGLARLFHERARASARSFQPAVIAAVAAVVTLREAGVGSDERERRDMAAGAFGVSTRAVRGAAKALVTLGALPPSTASRP